MNLFYGQLGFTKIYTGCQLVLGWRHQSLAVQGGHRDKSEKFEWWSPALDRRDCKWSSRI